MDVDDANACVGQLLVAWNLELEADWWLTPSSVLAWVRRRDDGCPCVLKVPLEDEERAGSRVLAWWRGDGAAAVYAMDSGGAVLMERAHPGTPLLDAAETAVPPEYVGDDDATRHLVNAAMRLHRRTGRWPEGLRSLRSWFRGLFPWADRVGGFYQQAACTADQLLNDQHDSVVLHGDLHHQNVLWFGPDRGYLAIDPKGIYGDPVFDYANLLTNPGRDVILRPGRLEHQVDLISHDADISADRLLGWTVAWAGLSAAWHQQHPPTGRALDTIQIGQRAHQLLN